MISYLKWVGGKKRLMPDISLFLPNTKINKYIEPFVGSASVIIWLYQNRYDNYIDNQVNINNTQFFLNDANKALINAHIQIKNNIFLPPWATIKRKYKPLQSILLILKIVSRAPK